MGHRLEGKVALITGGARGQGEQEARLFAAEGARVVLTDLLDAEGKAVAESIGEAALYRHHDVRRDESWAQVVADAERHFGRLDVLVNNAGILAFSKIADTTLEQYMKVIETNQVSVFLGMKAALPAMKRAGGGSIVNVSSTSGLKGTPATIAYTASKFAVRGMTKVAALELGRHGIRVNSMHPGGVATPMVGAGPVDAESPETREIFASLPLGRIGRPEEQARLALFLASDESSYCTGAEFIADGGMMAGDRAPRRSR
jgi:3alpha(or 20beta)-hydroxysteroid dehydrogenase